MCPQQVWGFFGGDKNALNLIVMMMTQLCEYTKNHSTIHYVQLNCAFTIHLWCVDYISIKLLLKIKIIYIPSELLIKIVQNSQMR